MLAFLLKKQADGRSALTLERADGTRTWQRQDRHAAFFAAHDLTHLAVETTLGLREAFLGRVAQGWDFDDFLPPYPRGATRMPAAEFNAQLAATLRAVIGT